jgi:hypothetical protein
VSSKPVNNAAHMTHAYCVHLHWLFKTLIGAYWCLLLNVDWVLIASVYDKNETRDSAATNEPSLHDSFQKQGVRLDVGIELGRCDL